MQSVSIHNSDSKHRVWLIGVAEKERTNLQFLEFSHCSLFISFSFSKVCLQLLLAVMTECQDLAIFVLTNRRTELIASPLAHVCKVTKRRD